MPSDYSYPIHTPAHQEGHVTVLRRQLLMLCFPNYYVYVGGTRHTNVTSVIMMSDVLYCGYDPVPSKTHVFYCSQLMGRRQQ